jgi:hypothetical protein
MLAWPDGGRLLIGHDAVSLRVEPARHPGLAAALPAIDAAVDAGRRVDLPARAADERPGGPAHSPTASDGGAGRGGARADGSGGAPAAVALAVAVVRTVFLGAVRASRRLRRRWALTDLTQTTDLTQSTGRQAAAREADE